MSAGAEVDLHGLIGQLDAELVAAPERSSLSPDQGLFRQSLGLL